ncbi:hypothetical protein K440DRAFT_645292 [Wilcoxina mikolae CBS 423.85]|nr:hypothetical protein K440DRAFT_645292 [Wilcoxina mikolae CBS 423.85]
MNVTNSNIAVIAKPVHVGGRGAVIAAPYAQSRSYVFYPSIPSPAPSCPHSWWPRGWSLGRSAAGLWSARAHSWLQVERSPAIVRSGLEVGIAIEQQSDHSLVTILHRRPPGRPVECSRAFVRSGLKVGSAIEQQSDRGFLLVMGRPVECSPAFVVGGLEVCSVVKKQSYRGLTPVPGSSVECSTALVRSDFGVG